MSSDAKILAIISDQTTEFTHSYEGDAKLMTHRVTWQSSPRAKEKWLPTLLGVRSGTARRDHLGVAIECLRAFRASEKSSDNPTLDTAIDSLLIAAALAGRCAAPTATD